MKATVEEHISVVELVLDGKIPQAHEALVSHIDISRAVVLDRARQALSLAAMANAVRN
jgi:hypothetical protein